MSTTKRFKAAVINGTGRATENTNLILGVAEKATLETPGSQS